jgi:hypothetical protein
MPDAACEVALEAAQRFAATLAFGLATGKISGGVGVQTSLGDDEAVQRRCASTALPVMKSPVAWGWQ